MYRVYHNIYFNSNKQQFPVVYRHSGCPRWCVYFHRVCVCSTFVGDCAQQISQADLMYHNTIVARCDGVHGVLYTRGGKWHRGEPGCHLPPRVYKTHGPQSQRATIVLLYLGNIIIPLLEVLLSSSNIITTELFIV